MPSTPRGTSGSVLSLFIGNLKKNGSWVGISIIHGFRDIKNSYDVNGVAHDRAHTGDFLFSVFECDLSYGIRLSVA